MDILIAVIKTIIVVVSVAGLAVTLPWAIAMVIEMNR